MQSHSKIQKNTLIFLHYTYIQLTHLQISMLFCKALLFQLFLFSLYFHHLPHRHLQLKLHHHLLLLLLIFSILVPLKLHFIQIIIKWYSILPWELQVLQVLPFQHLLFFSYPFFYYQLILLLLLLQAFIQQAVACNIFFSIML